MKCLVQEKVVEVLREIISSLRIVKNFLMVLINMAWNGFYENIWKKHCEIVIQWEKEAGISMRIKRRKRLVRLSLNSSKKDTILRGDSVRIKKSQLQNDRSKEKKKKKEEDSLEIKRAWLSSIEKLIENRSKPFSYGILG
ncbi:hypothetical protein C2G38_2225298 [Gigaspora rosea]|uniref:Uncharacterized protein n=1 Tax=Gigaspora rosea TaxID=44941 RepID=A0A397TZI5_9GLOM|nr:hypothetical protein C2G38_2225298 [Gigaspora rosea]